MALGQKLRERAAELGLSGSEVARRAHLDERRYGHYVRGVREPDLVTLLRICEVLLTTPNELLLDAPMGKGKKQSQPALPENRGMAESGPACDFQTKPDGREKRLAQLVAAAQELDADDLAAFTVQIKAVAALRKKKR
jgi:transcriptional regulator with XRE-family HTH domain